MSPTLKPSRSYSLPFAFAETNLDEERDAVAVLYSRAGRKYVPLTKPEKPSFKKHGDPGLEPNKNTIGYALAAYRLFGDRNALLQAALVAERLFETWASRDRAHSQRYAWLGPLAAALKEIGDPRWTKCLEMFNDIIRWLHGDKYVNGDFSGLTLRPERVIHEAALAGRFAVDLSNAGIPGVDATGGKAVFEKAAVSSVKWALRIVGGANNWGWLRMPGLWKPGFLEFPYLDCAVDANRKPVNAKRMATETTTFHGLHVFPYSCLMGEWAGLEESPVDVRWFEMASHSLRGWFDPASGRNVKSLGYDAKDSAEKQMGYYAPGFTTIPARRQSAAWKAEYMEQGYPDPSPAFIAVYRGGEITRDEAQKILVRWVKKTRGIAPGEVPIGMMAAAVEFGFAA